MKLSDRLSNETKKELREVASPAKNKKQDLSERELRELMGERRDRYTKVRGRVRNIRR